MQIKNILVVLTLLLCSAECLARSPNKLELPVRVHVVTSKSVPDLNARMSDRQARQLIAQTNRFWRPAFISWKVESIVREPAINEAQYRKAAANVGRLSQADIQRSTADRPPPQLAALGAALVNSLPKDKPLKRWDVFVVGKMPTISGALGGGLTFMPGMCVIGLDVPKRVASANPARVLAHELGHTLTLTHVPDPRNLMMSGNILVPMQIAHARKQAETGFGGITGMPPGTRPPKIPPRPPR